MSSAAPTTTAPAERQGLMTHRQILYVIFGLMAGMFLSALDQTIVGTSMRTIADDLDGLSLQAWVTTAYLIVSTISTPIYGKLSDIFGRRPLFLIAITIFLVGSIAARDVQEAHDDEQSLQGRAQAALADQSVLTDPANASILKLYQAAGNGDTSQVSGALDGNTSFLNTADRRLAAPFLDGFANAAVTVFWVALAVVLVAFALSFFLKATPLRQKSAIDEATDDARAAVAADAALSAQVAAAQTGSLVAPDTGSIDVVPAGDRRDDTPPRP